MRTMCRAGDPNVGPAKGLAAAIHVGVGPVGGAAAGAGAFRLQRAAAAQPPGPLPHGNAAPGFSKTSQKCRFLCELSACLNVGN